MSSSITHLECSKPNCGKQYPHTQLQNLCTCGGPLLARYNLASPAHTASAFSRGNVCAPSRGVPSKSIAA